MSFLVISSSLNPESRSRELAGRAVDLMKSDRIDVDFVDLRTYNLPLCDAGNCFGDEAVKEMGLRIRNAKGILVAMPIYNYGAGAAIKNLVELTGSAWTEKVVAFVCAAGGKSSYMSAMGLANSLMLDFRTVIVPRYVFVDDTCYEEGSIRDPKIDSRLHELTNTLVRFAHALSAEGYGQHS